jgi:hypothetical protein
MTRSPDGAILPRTRRDHEMTRHARRTAAVDRGAVALVDGLLLVLT